MRGLALDLGSSAGVRLVEDLDRPRPRAGEILVRVTHATVNGHEFDLAANRLVRAMAWLRRAPGQVRTGLEFAGSVASEGERHRVGDEVMGYIDIVAGWHPHADYVAIPEAYVAPLPRGMTPARASALPMGGLTALAAVREVASVQPGHEVLIVGASGGVGVMAVQLARILGARVTAVGSAAHHAELERLGATRTFDYRQTPIEAIEGRFDAILDFSSTLRLASIEHLLTPGGVFVPGDPMRNVLDVIRSRRARWLMVDRGDAARLRELAAWVEAGELEALVSDTHALDEWEQAVARSHERGRLGRIVLAFDSDSESPGQQASSPTGSPRRMPIS